MTDEEWEKQRERTIATSIQTGRPVVANADDELRFADGDRERVPDNVGVVMQPLPTAVLATHTRRAFRWTLAAAVANTIAGLWNPWLFAAAAVFAGCAVA